MGDRLVRWLYGLPNIVGSALALVGLGLYLGGVIHGPLVVVIIVGLYVLGALVTPRPKPLPGFMAPDGSLDEGEMRSALEKLQAEADKRLPDDLAAKVRAIHDTILEIVPKVKASSIDRRDLFVLERTVTDYLPSTLNAYLTLPRAYADSRVVQDGKTPKDLLVAQLTLIEEKMQAISDAVSRDDLNKLLAQGRFLEDKFGSGAGDALELPSAASPSKH
jgi:hypothetical protein